MCVESNGDGEVVGGYSLAPKRFVSAKRFPCPSQMAGYAPPAISGKRKTRERNVKAEETPERVFNK